MRRQRRRRHRDLPARVRRRQAFAVIGILVLIVGGAALVFGGGDDEDPLDKVPIEALVGQTVIGKVGKGGPDRDTLRRVSQGELGGMIIEPANSLRAGRDVTELQKAARSGGNPRLLIMIDQEGGPVKRLPDGPPTIAPADIGERGGATLAREQGVETGQFLKRLGINVDLAPVLDVPQAASPESLSARTFGTDPNEVAELGTAFAEGLIEGGVAPTAKHFPGLGQSLANTDQEKATVRASREELTADFEPFRSAIDADVPLVMMSSAIYPALGSNSPAAWSAPIIQGLLRDELGFDGAIITDDLESPAVRAARPPERAAAAALRNGGDLVLFARSEGASRKAYESLVKAAGKGSIERSVLEDSYKRVLALKDSITGD